MDFDLLGYLGCADDAQVREADFTGLDMMGVAESAGVDDMTGDPDLDGLISGGDWVGVARTAREELAASKAASAAAFAAKTAEILAPTIAKAERVRIAYADVPKCETGSRESYEAWKAANAKIQRTDPIEVKLELELATTDDAELDDDSDAEDDDVLCDAVYAREAQVKSAGGKYPIRVNTHSKWPTFRGARTSAARDEQVDKLIEEKQEVDEVVNGAKPHRAYLDIDVDLTRKGAVRLTDDDRNTIIEAEVVVALECGVPKELATPLVVRGDRTSKQSEHHISQWAVPSGRAQDAYQAAVRAQLPARLAEVIDPRHHKSGFSLRYPGCDKAGQPGTALSTLGLAPSSFSLQRSGLQVYSHPSWVWEDEPEPEAPNCAEDKVSRWVAEFIEEHPEFVRSTRECKGHIVASFDRLRRGLCEVCARVHDRAGVYITVADNGAAFARCGRSEKGMKSLKIWISDELRARYNQPMPEEDADDNLVEGQYERIGRAKTVDDPGTYNSEALGDLLDGGNVFMASAWGTGKNEMIVKMLNAARFLNSKLRVLVVTSRLSLTDKIIGDLSSMGFERYSKISGEMNPEEHPLLITQLEAAPRIRPSAQYDYIVLDEFGQTLAHAFAARFESKGKDPLHGLVVLKSLLKNAGRVIVTDNDLTQAQVSAIQALLPEKSARVVRNRYMPSMDVPVRFFKRGPLLARLWAYLDGQNRRRLAGEEWSSASVPCHSKKVANAIALEARKRYGRDLVKLYTADTDFAEKRRDLADADNAWAQALVIIYSPTITVGVSCSSTRIAQCFAFFNGRNVAAAQSAQMLMRCRKAQRIDICVEHRAAYDAPCTRDELYEWAVKGRAHRDTIPDMLRNDRNCMLEEPTSESAGALKSVVEDNFIGRLWVGAAIEKYRSQRWFQPRLERILTRAGLVIAEPDGDNSDGDEKLAAMEHKEAVKEVVEATANLQALNIEAWTELERAAADHGKTAEDTVPEPTEAQIAGSAAYRIARSYDIDPLSVSPAAIGAEASAEWIAYYGKNPRAYRDYAAGIAGCARGAGELSTASQRERVELSLKVLSHLAPGVAGSARTSVEVKLEKLEAKAVDTLFEIVNRNSLRLFDDSHGPRRRKSGSDVRRTVVATMNVALSGIGARLDPVYLSANDKKQGKPSCYMLYWRWAVAEAPYPQPVHPMLEDPLSLVYPQEPEEREIEYPLPDRPAARFTDHATSAACAKGRREATVTIAPILAPVVEIEVPEPLPWVARRTARKGKRLGAIRPCLLGPNDLPMASALPCA